MCEDNIFSDNKIISRKQSERREKSRFVECSVAFVPVEIGGNLAQLGGNFKDGNGDKGLHFDLEIKIRNCNYINSYLNKILSA